MPVKQQFTVENRTLTLTNLDKAMYPAASFTKAAVIDYYTRVSPWLLPHFKDRPVTLKRFPDGVAGQKFYEKDAPRFTPDWVQIAPVPRRNGGPDIRYIMINDLPTLVWCANIASLELHPFLHLSPNLDRPTSVVFDLDPGEGASASCAEVAFLLRDVLERLGLQAFPKVSGSKGIQIYVPLNTPASYAATQEFARSLARILERDHPSLIVSEMAKNLRPGKVFIDWSQNSDFKTTVGVYSLRAKSERPFVSLPVPWGELENWRTKGDSERLCLEPKAAISRIEELGDLFAPVLSLKQKLPKSAEDSKVLETYRKKRDFTQTREPQPTLPSSPPRQGRRFVIQKHEASHLHYDFRLEMQNVLKSWAVPKGVPYAPKERRLAMATEDHPIEYLEFEGTIPKGQYGGGTVMVWDIGTYELIDGKYYKGKLHILLNGKKLKGEWVLVTGGGEDKKKWFLLKAGSAAKPLSAAQADSSALTGRSMAQIAADNDAQWHSNRTNIPDLDLDRLPQTDLAFIEPMQATLVAELPADNGWQYEIKLDGYRALSIKRGNSIQLLSRRNNSLSTRFPGIAAGVKGLEDGLMLDGEIVALDDKGRPSFNLLQNDRNSGHPVFYYAFDLLAYRGCSLIGLPLSQRRELLQTVLSGVGDPIRLSAALDARPAELIAAAREQELEGLIAKRADSLYQPGQRSRAWVKFRINQGQELVIGGYKPGKDGFDNLAAGYYENRKLQFVAKIKNGFVPAIKERVAAQFKGLETDSCPFANLPEPANARRGEALTAEVMKKYRWLKPKLVAQVEFANWTAANHLRHSRFIALRDDKDPREVRHERSEQPDGR